ncbi:gamma-glutamylcyclotransferase [Aurantimicrobium minutum]|uniref:gamma-glutamylcyclotransferase n=1 Tax=Aurantimicrobium minutum TaxID=708131 RepID=UPI0024754778|nr:gamma-glutamylcyclotransferase [Aurantimicrobium minutum]MDH6422801.1 gamma-glutamylcyclotransferase (GGCT)/AIG2-like uncharacterized protein YtfP [Aurantimicrobium minutum]
MRLATYGTLGPGKPNHHHVSMIEGTWSIGFVRGFLHEEGWGAAQGFPGIILDSAGPEVAVDLLESEELAEHFDRLDSFEGPGYQRVLTEVKTSTEVLQAFIYELVQ